MTVAEMAGSWVIIVDRIADDPVRRDGARIRRECVEINKKQAEKDRLGRRIALIQQGVAKVSSCLLELKHEGEISDEDIGAANSPPTAWKPRCPAMKPQTKSNN